MKKRKFYTIYQIDLNKLDKKPNEEDKIRIGENLIIKLINALKGRQYIEEEENFIPELIYVNISNSMKNIEERIKEIDKNGFTINGIKYKRLGKSAAMARTGRIAFVDEKLKEQLEELIMLGKHIDEAVISKYEAYRGLSFSTCLFSDVVPKNVCIVDEYKTMINEYVKTIKDNQIIEGNFDVPVTLWDGMGVHSPEWSEKVAKSLDIPYTPVGYQIRLFPSIKGMSYEFDFKLFYKERGITKIKDVYGKEWNIEELDAIWNTSMFKFWKYFQSWDEFIQLREKYYRPLNMDKIGIAKWVIPTEKADKYSKTSYQYLQSLALTGKDVIELAQYTKELVEKVYEGDYRYTMAFLGLLANNFDDEESEEKMMANKLYTAFMMNPKKIYNDPHFRRFLKNQLQKTINEMKLGKLYIEGRNSFIAQDPIAYLEAAAGLEIKGCLKKGEFYSAGIEGYRATFRSPLIHSSEIGKDLFVHNELTDKWLSKYDNVLVLNAFDLTAQKHGGADFDGDTFFHTDNKKILNAVISENNPIIVNIDDKATSKTEKITEQAIIEYDLRTLDNRIGYITNLATFWTNLGNAKANVNLYDEYLTKLRIWQGVEIDSAKTGIHPIIDDEVKKYENYKPYFLWKYKYNSKGKVSTWTDKASLNILCRHIEQWEKEKFIWKKWEETDILEAADFLINKEVLNQNREEAEKLVKIMREYYKQYNEELGKLWLDNKFEDNKKMKQFYNKWYLKVNALHENKELLSSIAVHICYRENHKNEHSFNFPWVVAWEGILTTLEHKQEEEKILLRKVQETAEMVDVIEFLGRKYIEEVKKKYISPEKTITQLKKKINIEVPIVNIVGEEFAEKMRKNNIVILKPKIYQNKEYVSLFQNEEYIGSVAYKNDTVDIVTSLKEYYNTQFKVEIKKINKKSAVVELYIAS
ncbi:hypothetical protein O163_08220 [Caldanaerobacter subterraneus subsp. yonseiensis KB-1]|uniref:RDRP core domain-containing protein n=1 Tax=Caldanaerobacter subterraneus subsp. yonseiensis KB-1 TaxID=1388761 RepID=U5CPK2_CALSX|nr:hypothetical protein [Caldanaerobacter subterraneus]ERM91923.1 hypothetical protein O163_08220 [Caldanaerobacter subterraneus subsp. yonseiensis KB-1]